MEVVIIRVVDELDAIHAVKLFMLFSASILPK